MREAEGVERVVGGLVFFGVEGRRWRAEGVGMRVTGISVVPPPAAGDRPRLTPELLASVLARYSRSNEGLEAIVARIDPVDPEKSVDRILKFVDYGHASIGGLTGGIAMAVDGVSMWLAYKLFELSPTADGQESSTRYLSLDPEDLPAPAELGVPEALWGEWKEVMAAAFAAYGVERDRLEVVARERPEVVRAPPGAKPAVVDRMRRNYALDRVRYLLPFAAKTNVALVQTARAWAQVIRHLASMPQVEARACAASLRAELERYAPRLSRHATGEESHAVQAARELERSLAMARARLSTGQLADEVWVRVDGDVPPFLEETQGVAEALRPRANRYGWCGLGVRRQRVVVAWNNLAVAELRDLNRHRTGHRWSPLVQAGVYLPPEVPRGVHGPFLERQAALLRSLLEAGSPAYVYGLLLGSQTPFEHSTHGDKFVYTAELRTGLGAHFRYAEHLKAALVEYYRQCPEARGVVMEGEAEPE